MRCGRFLSVLVSRLDFFLSFGLLAFAFLVCLGFASFAALFSFRFTGFAALFSLGSLKDRRGTFLGLLVIGRPTFGAIEHETGFDNVIKAVRHGGDVLPTVSFGSRGCN